jgi:hypothetical protein
VAQENDLSIEPLGRSDYREVYSFGYLEKGRVLAQQSLGLLLEGRLALANRVSETPDLSADGVGGDPVSLQGIRGICREPKQLGSRPSPPDVLQDCSLSCIVSKISATDMV